MTDPKREGPKPTPGPSMDLDEHGDPIPRTRRPSPEAEEFARDWRADGPGEADVGPGDILDKPQDVDGFARGLLRGRRVNSVDHLIERRNDRQKPAVKR